jgi:EF-hand domain pair
MINVRAMIAAACLIMPGCQSDSGAQAHLEPSQERLEYITQISKIDTAGKGVITFDQATAYYGKLFAELDKNGDGFLDSSELQPLIPIMQARSGLELLSKLDRNADGKVSRSEFLVVANWLFQIARSNNQLTLEDAKTGAAPPVAGRVKSKDPADTPPTAPRR